MTFHKALMTVIKATVVARLKIVELMIVFSNGCQYI
jgi:hypothetical protein